MNSCNYEWERLLSRKKGLDNRHGSVIHNHVFPGSNPGDSKFDSTFHPSEVGEMSSSIMNAAQVSRGCADRQRSPW